MRKFLCLLLIGLFSFDGNPSFCQGVWHSTDGPLGGSIRLLFESQGGELYGATQENLFVREKKSGDWSLVAGPLKNHPIRSFAETANSIFVTVAAPQQMPSLYRTAKGRILWEPLPLLPGKNIRSMASRSNGELILADGKRIWVTKDGITGNDFIVHEEASIWSLAILPTDDILAGTTQGLFLSRDGGKTWALQTNGINADVGIWQIATSRDGKIAIAAIEHGVFTSENIDSGFEQTVAGLENENIYAVAINHTGQFYAGSESGSLFKLNQDKANWEVSFDGSLQSADFIWSVLIGQVNELYLSRSSEGVYQSTDGGSSWSIINRGLVASSIRSMIALNDRELLVGSRKGLFTYNPEDKIWQEILFDSGSWTSSCLHKTASGQILACSNSGLIELSIQGNQGHLVRVGPDSIGVIAIEEDAAGNIYTADWEKGIFKGQVNGAWEEISNAAMKESIITSLEITGIGDLFAGTNQGLWKLTEDSWHAVIPISPPVSGIESNEAGNIFITAFPGIHKSVDGGLSWTEYVVSPERPVYDFVVLRDQTLMAGMERDGVYRSFDNGNTWKKFSDGLKTSTVNKVFEFNDGVFAGTGGGGVYQLNQSTRQHDLTSLEDAFIPNPAGQFIYLSAKTWTSPVREINIYALTGQLVKRLKNSCRGTDRCPIYVGDLQRGIYMMVLKSNEKQTTHKMLKL